MAYLGHQKFLPQNHPFRHQMKSFNGQREFESIPEPLLGRLYLTKLKILTFKEEK